MKEKYTLTLDDNFVSYCKVNNLDVIEFAKKILNDGLMEVKYPPTPFAKKPMTAVIPSKNEEKIINKDNIYGE